MKKQVLGMELEGLNTEEMVERLMELLHEEKVGVCAFVQSAMLLEAEKNETYREMLGNLNLALAGDMEIQKAMGEQSEEAGQETEMRERIGAFLERLTQEKHSVAVLTETAEEKETAREYLNAAYPSLKLSAVLALEEFEDQDAVLNHINGVDVEVLLAELSVPEQETFIFNNRSRLNISLWIGLGKVEGGKKKAENMPGFFERLLEKRIFKKKVTQYF